MKFGGGVECPEMKWLATFWGASGLALRGAKRQVGA
jgi:hypothetical protein